MKLFSTYRHKKPDCARKIKRLSEGSMKTTDDTEELFEKVYTDFKMHFYRAVFHKFSNREASLTTVETFCMEVIYAMKNPTVNEFANFIQISSPNAAYKINNLIQKGYLTKVQSREDKREYYLQVTQKYLDYYNISTSYVSEVLDRVRQAMTPEERGYFHRSLEIILEELKKDDLDPAKKSRGLQNADQVGKTKEE